MRIRTRTSKNVEDSVLPMKPLHEVARSLRHGTVPSEALVLQALDRTTDPDGEGIRTFVRIYGESALERARAIDRLGSGAHDGSILTGVPVSIKDLFDVAGEVTCAGSVVLTDAKPAATDAEAVRRLRAAGAVIVGRTNMSEFAYSAIGTNPHFGTPRNPFDRAVGRIPGGSSSGAAVSVTDGMATVAIGSDTGGSVRIPAALCGIAGFKPTQARVPRVGTLPLSPTLDSIGPLAPTVACCAAIHAVLCGESPDELNVLPRSHARLALPSNHVIEALEPPVATAFERALSKLSRAGWEVAEVPWPELDEIPGMLQSGSITAAEAFAWHRELLLTHEAAYDPLVRQRLDTGERMSPADYLEWLAFRTRLMASAKERIGSSGTWIMPTVPLVAPPICDLERDSLLWAKVNEALLRNPMIANLIDGCALSLPCHIPGDAPVGLMLMGVGDSDWPVLQLGMAIEPLFA